MVCKLCDSPVPISPAPSTPFIETLLRRLLNKVHTVGQDDYRVGASDSSVERHDKELDAAREEVMEAINVLQIELAKAREQIVWGFHEEEVPQYTQGPKGEHEMTEPIAAEEANGLVKTIVDLRAELTTVKTDKDLGWIMLRNYLKGAISLQAAQKVLKDRLSQS